MRGIHAVKRSDRFWAGLFSRPDYRTGVDEDSQNIRWIDKGRWIQGNTEKYMAIFEIFLQSSEFGNARIHRHILPQVSTTRKCKYQGKKDMKTIVNIR